VKNSTLTGCSGSESCRFGVRDEGWLQYLQHLTHPRGALKGRLVAILMGEQTEKFATVWWIHYCFQHGCEMLITAPRKPGMDLSMEVYSPPKWKAMPVCPYEAEPLIFVLGDVFVAF
jgi:hypothetical protein